MKAAARAHVDVLGVADRSVRVRPFHSGDASAWDRFVEACPDATFFHRIGWRRILENVFHHPTHYLLAERGGVVCGVLPLAQVRSRLFGHALVSLPFGVYGGPAASDAAAERALIDAAEAHGAALRVEHLELRNRQPKTPAWPRQHLYVTFRKTLAQDESANMLAIPRKQRAMVRKGIQQGLRSETDHCAARFFALYRDNQHRHGTPALPRRYFEALLETFADSCDVLVVTDAGGGDVSAVLSFYFRDEVLPYYAGDALRARALAANDFKYWELMRRALARGVRVFDYGRSKQGTGSYAFKKNWGFVPEPLAYEYRLYRGGEIPQKNPLNPKYRAMIALWRRLPRTVVDAVGPMLAKNLG
jgi:FemAB-related protein (PEP-CTERM system-associated)